MNQILIIVLLVLISNNISSQNKTITYKRFITCNQGYIRYDKSQTYINWTKKDLEGQIKKIEEFSACSEYQCYAYKELFRVYFKMGNRKKAFFYAEKAFGRGQDYASIIDTNLLLSKKDIFELKKRYEKELNFYQKTTDSTLKNKVNDIIAHDQSYRSKTASKEDWKKQKILDSLNIIEIHKIVDKYQWSGKANMGVDIPLSNISLAVIHSTHENNAYFLEKAILAAEKNITNWSEPASILRNMMWRFEQKDGFNKLRKVYLNKKKSLDMEKSYFQLHVLSNVYKTNKYYKLSFFYTYYSEKEKNENSNQKLKTLEEIKDFLIKDGISEERIEIIKEPRMTVDDKLGKFMFGFTTSKIPKK
ncbi:MAG: hypothetical protein EAZ06_09465 [Cytophagales bacterium]|nr:MAG: hypothetical protein EAZ06_09465 [Cytophagales bacterium]